MTFQETLEKVTIKISDCNYPIIKYQESCLCCHFSSLHLVFAQHFRQNVVPQSNSRTKDSIWGLYLSLDVKDFFNCLVHYRKVEVSFFLKVISLSEFLLNRYTSWEPQATILLWNVMALLESVTILSKVIEHTHGEHIIL